MAFKAYYRKDICDALKAAQIASTGGDVLLELLLQGRPLLWAVYRLGFSCALGTIASTFGVDAPLSPVLLEDVRGLLE